ncbi:MAG: tryptophan-rich sensory protein, partial [Candidatus Thermoplasmatota archaeon]|nr:tryptophan-rich sensory protein [Candidatus Thermoplasmatota archaeon]
HVMALFYSQLGLNLSWSVVFFGWENVGGALFIIFMMILFTIALMVSSYRRGLEKVVLLLVPYLAWISFASMLNLSILFLQA